MSERRAGREGERQRGRETDRLRQRQGEPETERHTIRTCYAVVVVYCVPLCLSFSLPNATEIFLFDNMLECIPPSLFNIPTLQMLNLDRNHLMEIPSTVSFPGNKIKYSKNCYI